MMRRLPATVAGEWIDRTRPLTLQFESRTIQAFAGDTLSSALAGAGVMITARSFKYHRPRGIVSAAGHDANNLYQIGVEPNQRGDHILARDGLTFSAVNTHGGVARDRAAAMTLLARFLPVGFYYKAFMGRSFPWFERVIRSFSGLGKVDVDAPGTLRERCHAHCDVAVIGAGASGLSAALAAAAAGARRVVLVDEAAQPGGSGLWLAKIKPEQAARCRELIEAVRTNPAIQTLCSHSVVGCYADNELAIARIDREDGGMTLLRAGAVVLATGAIEQPAVFRNNDLPGVLLGSAAQRLLYRHGIAVGRRIAILGANDEAVALALDLASHGLKVVDLIVPLGSPLDTASAPVQKLKAAGLRVHGHVQDFVVSTRNDGSMIGFDFRGMEVGATKWVRRRCDALLVSTGWMPALQLLLQRGGTIRFDATLGQHVPDALPRGLFVAGRANGCFAFDARLADGRAAGSEAARHAAGTADASVTSVPSAPRDTPQPLACRTTVSLARRQGIRGSGRGSHAGGSRQRRAGGLRQRRADEALQHGWHGPFAGQAVEPQCRATAGARHGT